MTITKNRTAELLRAVDSVVQQDYPGKISHIIVGDESTTLRDLTGTIRDRGPNSVIRHISTSERSDEFQPVYIDSKLGFLRNCGLYEADADLICYLDDDNYMRTNHISSLVKAITRGGGCDIAYSWREMLNDDGTPWLASEYPWTPIARFAVSREALSRYIFDELVASEVREVGSAIVRDCVIAPNGDGVFTVDTNEFMVWRQLHLQHPNVVKYTWREMVGDYSSDYAWIRKMYLAGYRFVATSEATVCYRIGGTSNR